MARTDNSYQVETTFDGVGWHILGGSIGNRSYAYGYFNALKDMLPRRACRLVDSSDGSVIDFFESARAPQPC